MLQSLDLVAYGSASSTLFHYAGLLMTLAGVVLRLYQQRLMGQNALRNSLFRFVIGLAIVAVLMATGLVRTPAFLLQLF
jgi:4-hydroxybenzoate polyprenyltransferase